jgi:hypothetical protein
MATKIGHIDLATIPETHKSDFRSGWYMHPSGVPPVGDSETPDGRQPPTQFTYDR